MVTTYNGLKVEITGSQINEFGINLYVTYACNPRLKIKNIIVGNVNVVVLKT